MLGKFENTDRRIKEPSLEPVDILLLTLDAETYLERCLDSVYKEIPVNKVIVADGGSKDRTVEILKKYPRVEINVRPDIRTTGKCYEFMLSRATTPWIVFMDADIELPAGWYDDMVKHKNEYDFFGCKRIMHYEFYRPDPLSPNTNRRAQGAPWMVKLKSLKGYHVDDDYMWRATDILLRQVVEKNRNKYGEIATTYHFHHTTDNPMYESDKEKRGSRLVFTEPTMEILDQKNWTKREENFRKSVVKYIDPEFIYPRNDSSILKTLAKLDPKWVKATSPKWYNILARHRKNIIIRKLTLFKEATLTFLSAIRQAVKAYLRQLKDST